MNSLYSDEQKKLAIARFIYQRGNKKAEISYYSPITDYLNRKTANLLFKLSKSGSNYTGFSYEYYYTDSDARRYVDLLSRAVSGTLEETITEKFFKKAINQLFMFLFNFAGTLSSDVDLLVSCKVNDELEARLKGYEKQLSSIDIHMDIARGKIKQNERTVNRMNKKIITALDRIHKWQQLYQPYLDDIKSERDGASDLEKSLKGGGKNEKK